MNFLRYASQKLHLPWSGRNQESSAVGEVPEQHEASGSATTLTLASFPNSGGQLVDALLTDLFAAEVLTISSTVEHFDSGVDRAIFVFDDPAEALCRTFFDDDERARSHASTDNQLDEDDRSAIDDFCETQFDDWSSHTQSWLDAADGGQLELRSISLESLLASPIETLVELSRFTGVVRSWPDCYSVVVNHLRLAKSQTERTHRWHALDTSNSIDARNHLSQQAYNAIQNEAQILYRRAMMAGVELRDSARMAG